MRSEEKPESLSHQLITNGELDLTVISGEEGTVLFVGGRVSIDSSPAFRERLLGLLRSKPAAAVVVDLTSASYIDTSGLATLLEALKTARLHGLTLRLRGLQGRLLHLFEATGVLSLFEADSQPPKNPTEEN